MKKYFTHGLVGSLLVGASSLFLAYSYNTFSQINASVNATIQNLYAQQTKEKPHLTYRVIRENEKNIAEIRAEYWNEGVAAYKSLAAGGIFAGLGYFTLRRGSSKEKRRPEDDVLKKQTTKTDSVATKRIRIDDLGSKLEDEAIAPDNGREQRRKSYLD